MAKRNIGQKVNAVFVYVGRVIKEKTLEAI